MTAAPYRTDLPGPSGDKYLGNLHAFSSDPLGFLTDCSRRYGDVVRLGENNVLLTDPADVEKMLVDRDSLFSKASADTRRGSRRQGFPHSTMNSDGDRWKAKRHRLQPAFGRSLSTKAAEIVDAQGEKLLRTWLPGQARTLQDDIAVVTLRLVTQLMFGDEFSDRDTAEVARLVAPIMDLSTSPVLLPEWVPTPRKLRIRRSMARIDRTLHDLAASPAAHDPERAPVLHALVHGTPAPSPEELRDELATLIMAGFETTNDAVVWTSFLLARHPRIAERVRAEADAAFATTPAGLPRMEALPYTHAVVRESLRLYSPVWLTSRDAREDLDFGGYLIPAGTTVTVSQWVAHRDPRFWEEAEAFRPERWLGGGPSSVPRGSYFPFGLGPRVCVGAAVATTETVHLVADIWRRFRLELTTPDRVHPRPALALQPVGVEVIPRPW
ncbi:cytochrome P450 [Streptomyces violaceusniger]|uniref:Cytochrome P450 hydroxylase n=1 Tax=Streptomyces violaceusniger TaxID=68280 RepID=A0A4D4LCM0_STRVO|nr:cytochrome P450 hydroxylase [Streptomyces violaceusniger]